MVIALQPVYSVIIGIYTPTPTLTRPPLLYKVEFLEGYLTHSFELS